MKWWQKYWQRIGRFRYNERKRKAAAYDAIASLPSDHDLTHFEDGQWAVRDWCGFIHNPATTPEGAIGNFKKALEEIPDG